MSNKKQRNKEIRDRLAEASKEIDDLHRELFPEEYDYIYDDAFDAARRKQGINPMNAANQEKVNTRRQQMGVLPFGETQSTDSELISSWEYCNRKLATGQKS